VAAGAAAVAAGIAAAAVISAGPGGTISTTGLVPTGSSPEHHPDAAEAALAAYRDDLGLRKLSG
jgi:NAD(P)H-dependent flavin oxidoreductase YrpB (nitropropane dioxygenase family)